MKYVCQTECFWSGRLWEVGESYEGSPTPPKHFVPEAEFKPEEPKGEALDKPMTLSEAQTKVSPKKKKVKGAPKSLKEASDLFS